MAIKAPTGRPMARAVGAAEQALGERAVGDDPDAEAPTGRADAVALDSAFEQAVLDLVARHP